MKTNSTNSPIALCTAISSNISLVEDRISKDVRTLAFAPDLSTSMMKLIVEQTTQRLEDLYTLRRSLIAISSQTMMPTLYHSKDYLSHTSARPVPDPDYSNPPGSTGRDLDNQRNERKGKSLRQVRDCTGCYDSGWPNRCSVCLQHNRSDIASSNLWISLIQTEA